MLVLSIELDLEHWTWTLVSRIKLEHSARRFEIVLLSEQFLGTRQMPEMALTSESMTMCLRKFDESNMDFWKEQMQEYVIVKGNLDPIENESASVE